MKILINFFATLVVLFIAVTANAQFINRSFKVFGACEQCKERIEKAVSIKGVKNPVWDVDTKMLSFEQDSSVISIQKIESKILNAGHDLIHKKAKEVIYNQLPACCHYRELLDNDTVGNGMTINAINKMDHTKSIDSSSSTMIKGIVVQETSAGKLEPLQNASVYWLGTNKGVVTDSLGIFEIQPLSSNQKLVISYVGFGTDTIFISNNADLKIIKASKNQLKEVTIFSRTNGMFIPTFNPIRMQVMTGTELLKAACCNLSESFETNPSVDVSYNDAITGSKQIQLLGLSGNYTQLTIENMPGPRGLATPLGLNSIAGPWIESIQLTKGVGSVANGFESIAGQINVELKKPESAEKLLANIYSNEAGKTDVNLNVAQNINTKWSTALLLHDNFNKNKLDQNKDGFIDLPTGNQFGIVNRYKYDNSKGVMGQFGIKLFNENRQAGQIVYDPTIDKGTTNHYGVGINTERYELFGKIGYVFPRQKFKSIGLQLTAINYQQDAYYGLTDYNGTQKSFYGNLIYQSIINSTIHKFRTGLSFQLDDYNEKLKTNNYIRKESVPGTFFEYTYTPTEKFALVAGIRADQNSIYGSLITPRLNMRYEPIKGTVIRISAGKGQRTANIFAENNSVLVSTRKIEIITSSVNGAYGLMPEIAWNKGITVDHKLNLFNRPATIAIDYFRNDFTNQVVVDLENPRLVQFYNLQGKSYSNSIQGELNMEPLKKLDIRVAYRYFEVLQDYNGQLLERPFIAKNRAFVSVDYATTNNWKFNYTVTLNGKKRLSNTSSNPTEYQMGNYSPSYTIMNAQVSKSFSSKHQHDFYIGVENLTDKYQQYSIVSSDQPFSRYFDATMIWGPTFGRMWYLGWRMKIK